MRLRKAERDSVIEVLERDHESAEEAAEAVFNRVVDLLSQRDCYAVGYVFDTEPGLDEITIGYGPFWDLGTTKRFVNQLPGGVAGWKKLRPAATPPAEESGPCPDCGHQRNAHIPGHGCVIDFRARINKGRRPTILNPGCGCQREGGR